MDPMKKTWMILLPALALAGCGHKDTIDPGVWNSYRNPVWQEDVRDPAVLLDGGHFYLFSSETADVLLPMATSDNLTEWGATGSAIDDADRPTFLSGGTLQSPDVAKVGGQYLLYYSLYASDASCGIGVATADVPTGPYKDHGAIVTAAGSGLKGVASPGFFADETGNYLVFGHFNGIYLLRLSANGLAPEAGAAPVRIANESFAAPTLLKREGQYILLVSRGAETGGEASPCVVVAGRADRPEGPYLDPNGKDLTTGIGEAILGSGTKFAGPGHGCVVTLPDGTDWMIYNAYDLSDVSKGRTLMLDRILWTDGWPSIRGAVSSFCTDAPVPLT